MLDLTHFPITCELSSVTGADITSVLTQAREIRADAFNLPDGILGRLTVDPIALAYHVRRETGKPVIAHLTCRDTTQLGLASRLLGAATLGIDGVLVLTGDAGAKNVFELRSEGLTKLTAELNAGTYAGKPLRGATHLQIGVAVNPNVDGQIEYLKKKIAAGAMFVQTQPVFDIAVATRFLDALERERIAIPILFGVMPLKSLAVAQYFNQNVTGVTIPPTVLDRLHAEPEAGLTLTLELLRAVRPRLAGVHVMPLGRVDWANAIYDELHGKTVA